VVVASLAVAGCGDGGGDRDGEAARAVSARTSLTPSTHLFAEPVVARLDVVLDADAIDTDEVEVTTDFEPYEVLRERRTHEDFGRLTRLHYEVTLRCLLIACIPEVLQSAAGEAETGRGERATIRLAPARVAFDDPDSGERKVRNAPWPPLESVSRITASDVPSFGFVFKTSVVPLVEPTYRVPPAALAGGLAAAALALLALPATLVGRWARRRRPAPPQEAPELTPLERALALVEWANERERATERREALEVLAVELDALERGDLAGRARELAWSAGAPSPEGAETLVRSVRESDGRS
jgi:hypothetical protein